ncbi:MAG: LptF/LptG family permease, partial [Thermoguttaceae bacterium]|nr:LptF/LptG family permease [Thermoguttaceae bacterium]
IQFAFITLTTAITFFMLEKNNSGKVRGGEVIQMLTSGFSRKRVAMPFFIVGCLFIFFMCFAEEAFYIYCRDWPGANSNSLLGKVEIKTMDMQNDVSTGLKIYGTNLDLQTNSFLNPRIGIPKERTMGQLDELLASKAYWLPESDDHPAGFMLEGVMDLDKENWLARAVNTPVWLPHLNTELPVFYTSEVAHWVSPGNIFIISSLIPEDLTKDKSTFLPESLPDLYKKINSKRQLGPKYKERFNLHSRLVRPFLECTLLFLCIPVILSAKLSAPELRYKVAIFVIITTLMGLNVGLAHIGKLLVIQDGIPAAWGAWFPLIFLAPVCAILFDELYT